MTQFPNDDPYQSEYREESKSNPLGIVGFVLSLLCVTSPIGLLISLIALMKSPRGFAIAGVLIGLVFSAILAVGVWIVLLILPYLQETGTVIEDADSLRNKISAYQTTNNGTPPTSLDDLNWTDTDPWGNSYVLVVDPSDKSWTLTTLGPDSVADTFDDLAIESDMDEQDVSNAIAEWIGKRMEERFQPKP